MTDEKSTNRDHPRTRGEKVVKKFRCIDVLRITPAHAGKSLVYAEGIRKA